MKNSFLTLSLLTCLALVAAPRAEARELEGITLPETVSVGGKTLQLNGLGARQATFLKINVYVAGLYVEKTSQDGAAIIKSPELKKIEMKFMRNVDAEKLRGAWDESLEKNCDKDCADVKDAYEKLKKYMSDMKTGDTMAFTFMPDGVQVDLQGNKAGVIPGDRFSKILLSTWLGDHPPNGGLKDGMLGLLSSKK
jgi:hypothetical protein